MGKSENDPAKELWICRSGHQFCPVVKTCQVTFNNKTFSRSFLLVVPDNFGPRSSLNPSKTSLGIGFDRGVRKRIKESQRTIDDGNLSPDFLFEEIKQEVASKKPTTSKKKIEKVEEEKIIAQAECESLKSRLAEQILGRCQDWEQSLDRKVGMNPTLKSVTGINVHQEPPVVIGKAKKDGRGNKRYFSAKKKNPVNKKQ